VRTRVAGAIAALAALVQLALLFADWFTVTPTPATTVPPEFGASGVLNLLNTYSAVPTSGWDTLSAVALTPLIATAALALALPVTARVTWALRVLATVSLVVLALRVRALAQDGHGATVSLAAAAYGGLACAAVLVAAAWAARPPRGA
jgi:hypothetical protein